MRILNAVNGADRLLEKYIRKVKDEFPPPLTAVFMGIAYGGDVELCAKLWKGIGRVFGYDTFESGHPKHLAHNPNSHEAICMDGWYRDFGMAELALEYQQGQLDQQGLDNAVLVKGEVSANSCFDLEQIHLAWLDMDLNVSMENGFMAVKDKVVPGGYLLLHDVVPQGHITGNYELFYGVFLDPEKWTEVERVDESYFCAWQRQK